MKQPLSSFPYILMVLVCVGLLASLLACDPQIEDPANTDPVVDTAQVLELGEPMTVARTFLADNGVTEDQIHEALLKFTVGYNRVATLANSVFFADLSKTDRGTMKKRVAASLVELDVFLDVCKDLETVGTGLEAALDAYETTYPPEAREAMSRASRAEEGDTWYARRLIELMLDYENPVRFDLNDISRRTGVGMKKLHYIMQQTANQLNTEIDIVDAEEYDKEIAYLETVRDTAGKINSTLALATPLGAFAGTATATATTTAASAVGWIGTAKKVYTVAENANAVITFTDGVVNLAVDQEDIPPAFKTVAEYNSYIGIAMGGIAGFKGDTRGDKLVGILGAATDSTTKYFEVKDAQVKVSETPRIEGTPSTVDTELAETLRGIMPEGAYKVPTVDYSEWEFPDFDWEDPLWEDFYDGELVDDALALFLADLDQAFQAVIDTWDPSVNNAKLQEILVDTEGLPEFFEDDELDETFPDQGEVADGPETTDFTVEVFASASDVSLPFTVNFMVVPSESFVLGQTEYEWDFGDGASFVTKTTAVSHDYTTLPADSAFAVTVTATDPRGYSASVDKTITVGRTLQQIIDSYPHGSTIWVPAGTYTESITLHEGSRLKGAGRGSTIIEGAVALDPDTILESLTVRGTPSGGGIHNSYDAGKWTGYDTIDIDLIDVAVEQTPVGTMAIRFEDTWSEYEEDALPFGGTITRCLVKDNLEYGIYVPYLDGEISETILENNTDINLSIGKTTVNCYMGENEIRGSNNLGFDIAELNGYFHNNLVEDNGKGGFIHGMNPGAAVTFNTIRNNSIGGGLGIGEMFGGELKDNTVSGNSSGYDGGGIAIDKVYPGSIIIDNVVTNNSTSYRGGGVAIADAGYHAVKVGYLAGSGSVFNQNTITGNQALREGGGMYLQNINNMLIDGNTVMNNTANLEGGGIFVLRSYGTISTNTITNNLSKKSGGGMAITELLGEGSAIGTLSGNDISHNSVVYEFATRGGGLSIITLSGSATDNTITDNHIDTGTYHGSGGGASIGSLLAGGVFDSNTASGNSVNYQGGGVYVSGLSAGSSFKNNSISANSAGDNGGGCYVAIRSADLPYNIKDMNTISGNTVAVSLPGTRADLYTNIPEDRIPVDDP